MNTVRIIPRLDIKGPNLVKGIHLEGLRVLGSPERFARYYYEQGADELFFQDVVASLYQRNSLRDIISRTAREIFIPLTVGGGLRTVDDIRAVLRAGADKVAINTAALQNPGFIREAARRFGSSTIVVAIEASKADTGRYLCYTDNGREHTGMDAVAWARRAEELGCGEIVITSIDREGTGEGYDLELIRRVAEAVSIPVIAHGGMGKPQDAARAVGAKASALTMASVLHYAFIDLERDLDARRAEGNISFLKSGRAFSKIKGLTLPEIKNYLTTQQIDCRNDAVAKSEYRYC